MMETELSRSINLLVRAIFGLMIFSLVGCSDPVDEINEIIQSTTGDLQAKRALTISTASIEEMERVDTVLAVNKQTIDRIRPNIIESLNDNDDVLSNGIEFESLEFIFTDQLFGLDFEFLKSFDEISLRARMQVSAYLAATSNSIQWNLYIDGIEVVEVDGMSWPYGTGIEFVANALTTLTPVLNAIIDETINDDPNNAIFLSLDSRELLNIDLSESSTGSFVFDEIVISTGMQTEAVAIDIDENGIFIAAQVKFVSPNEVTRRVHAFPKDDELVRLSTEDSERMLREYRDRIEEVMLNSAGEELNDMRRSKATRFAVTRPAISRLLNYSLGQGSISGKVFLSESSQSTTELNFEIGERECEKYLGVCEHNDICEGDQCLTTILEAYKEPCKVNCCLSFGIGIVGCIVSGLCDSFCDATRPIVVEIGGGACEAFRQRDELYRQLYGGGLCEVASNVDKAFCDVEANLRKAACDAEQELRRFYDANPIAIVTLEVEPDATLEIGASNASVDSHLTILDLTLSARGGGRIRASIDYDRRSGADALPLPPEISSSLLCRFDWKEDIEVDVTADPFEESIRFVSSWEVTTENALEITFSQEVNKTVFVDFSPAPLTELFAGKPHVTLNCPLMAVGAIPFFGAYEALFTQDDARSVLPLLSGENFPVEIKDNSFRWKLEPIIFCNDLKTGECEQPSLLLLPSYTPHAIVFSEEGAPSLVQ